MKRIHMSVAAAALVVSSASIACAQDASVKVQGGGVAIQGWTGKIDASEAGKGMKLEDAKLDEKPPKLHYDPSPVEELEVRR